MSRTNCMLNLLNVYLPIKEIASKKYFGVSRNPHFILKIAKVRSFNFLSLLWIRTQVVFSPLSLKRLHLFVIVHTLLIRISMVKIFLQLLKLVPSPRNIGKDLPQQSHFTLTSSGQFTKNLKYKYKSFLRPPYTQQRKPCQHSTIITSQLCLVIKSSDWG